MCWQHEESTILVVEDMRECLDHDPRALKPPESRAAQEEAKAIAMRRQSCRTEDSRFETRPEALVEEGTDVDRHAFDLPGGTPVLLRLDLDYSYVGSRFRKGPESPESLF
jgi:hypothetical protein